MDLLDLYERASEWTVKKVAGAMKKPDAKTPCDQWKVRDLMNHLVESNQYFAASGRGEEVSPPQGTPADVTGEDPKAAYVATRDEILDAFGKPGVVEKMGPRLGLVFVEQLVHGWDLAKATGQNAKMPRDLAESAWTMIDGRMAEDQRGTFFKAPLPVPDDATAQEKLLAYSGRKP